MRTADFLIVGAGMAGISIAYELARSAHVLVLERESQPRYHTTGRSAALFSEMYGSSVIRGLARCSRGVLFDPPPEFADSPFVQPRGAMFIGSREQQRAFDDFRAVPHVRSEIHLLGTAEAASMIPILRPERAAHIAYEPGAMDIDVQGLHQAYLKGMRAHGGELICGCAVMSIAHCDGRWLIETADGGAFSAAVLVNAAGAWADEIARMATVPTVDLTPMRRTVLLVDTPRGVKAEAWPFVMDVEETFYFKPDAGKLLLSPADETPSSPCDAQPEDLDVAIAMDRVEQATTLTVQNVAHRWAGLRSFVADRTPVAGFDGGNEGFFWFAGQGGYGIQTAPALARVAAALALRERIPEDIAEQGISAAALSPSRLRPTKVAHAAA